MIEPWKDLSAQTHSRDEILATLADAHERSMSNYFQGQSVAGTSIGGYFSRAVVEQKTRDIMVNIFSETLARKFSEGLTQEESDALARLSRGQTSQLCLELTLTLMSATREDVRRYILWLSPSI